MSRYYDFDGQPITMNQWVRLFKNNQMVKTKVGGFNVSTVYLGLDHRFGDGPPLICETMIFGGALDQDCERYSTKAEALAGHEMMVQRCRSALAASFVDVP